MRIFATNPVLAKSKFWYFMKRQHKVRKVQGEIVNVSEVILFPSNLTICLSIDRRKKDFLNQELRDLNKILVQNRDHKHVQGVQRYHPHRGRGAGGGGARPVL